MADNRGPAERGLMASLRALDSTVLDIVGTRAELALIELREEADRRKQMLALSLLAGLFIGLALVFASLFVVVSFWDSHRLLALGGVTLMHAVVGVWVVALVQRKARTQPKPFEATLAELARDRDMLKGMSG